MMNRIGSLSLAAFFCAAPVDAHLTKIAIEQRTTTGASETLSGHFFGELDPKDPHNTIITDIQFAPKNARGMVEYSATFAISKPVDMSKASGVLFYSVSNRGGGAATPFPEGHISVISGWQGDLIPNPRLQTITVPVAKNPDGSPITGPVMDRFVDIAPNTSTMPLGAPPSVGLTYQRPASLDTTKATLNRRGTEKGPNMPVASTDWAFADCTSTPFPGKPDPSKVCVKGGFGPAYLYELSFIAKDPLVLGIGFAATRDLNSFLRYGDKDEAGTANPVAKQIKWALARGTSQSGAFIRSYTNLGFNQDEAGRIVWDGINPHIAARQLALNYRFAAAGGNAGPYEPGSDGVVWWSDYADKVRNHPTAGLLDRCHKSNTCPKILETFGGLEFWYLRESPDLVGTDAKADIPLPSNVRRYFFPGTTHGGGRGGFKTEAPAPPKGCILPANPNPEAETMRALTVALVDWVTKGIEPPASRYPHREGLADATKTAIGFPTIPGVPSPDGIVNSVLDYDWGPGFNYNDVSGVMTKVPPTIKQVIPTLVPKVDSDGTDLAGVPSVLRQAPLGTYTGWNIAAEGFNKGNACGLNGSYIPFARTKAERLAKGDPRPSIEERYASHKAYVGAVKAAADKAVSERFLLREDADRLIAEADASDVRN